MAYMLKRPGMLIRIPIICSLLLLWTACSQSNEVWPGHPPQVQEMTVTDGRYHASANFYYDSYNQLTGILFTDAAQVFDCEAVYPIGNKVLQIPNAIDGNEIIELVWESGKVVQYFNKDRIVHFRYENNLLEEVEVLINGSTAVRCDITYAGNNISVIEKYDDEDLLLSKTEYLNYDDRVNPLTDQWWYWWIARDKGYHWEEDFPILLFMQNNPSQVKTTVDGLTLTNEIQYVNNEQNLITEISIPGDGEPSVYKLIY